MKVYKYYPPVEYAFRSFEEQIVCFNSMANFTDELEGNYKMVSRPEPAITEMDGIVNSATGSMARIISEKYTEFIRFIFRVLSVTDSALYKYMWNEYAQNGSGFCLEYESNELERYSYRWGEINYKDFKEPDGIFQDNFKTGDFCKMVDDILFTKVPGVSAGEDYKQEHEIRYVLCIPEEMIEETDINDYINNHFGRSKDKEYTYYADFLSGKHLKARNLIFRKANVSRVIMGQKISKESSDRIKAIAEKKRIPLSTSIENVLL